MAKIASHHTVRKVRGARANIYQGTNASERYELSSEGLDAAAE